MREIDQLMAKYDYITEKYERISEQMKEICRNYVPRNNENGLKPVCEWIN